MRVLPLVVRSVGVVSPVGLTAASSMAAIRCRISAARETGFVIGGAPVVGAAVPFEDNVRGRARLLRMSVQALDECLEGVSRDVAPDLPIILCLSKQDRPGRANRLDASFVKELRRAVGLADAGAGDSIITAGRTGAALALKHARDLAARGRDTVAIVAVDTLLTAPAIAHFAGVERLLTENNSNGFIPGEAAAAVLVTTSKRHRDGLTILAVGLGHEPAPVDSGKPLRGDGMVAAVESALSEAGIGYQDLDFRISDASGEQYRFKELSLALARTMRVRKPEFDLWHPAESTGEIGAAAGLVMISVAATAGQKGYAPGPGALLHLSNDDGARAAIVCRYQPGGS